MISTHTQLARPSSRILQQTKKLSLSTYFPAGTRYFYGYPAGEDSGFLNKVPPKVEELVAARALSCAGPDVSVISFAATAAPAMDKQLLDEFGIPGLPTSQITILPPQIDSRLQDNERNEAVKNALCQMVPNGSLVMAQPYTDEHMSKLYQIPAITVNFINAKDNMKKYISSELLPKQLAFFASGPQLAKHAHDLSFPCVIKVSSSSSGDGVYLCQSRADIKRAVKKLETLKAAIVVQEYVEAKKNYAIHFGIPHDQNLSINLLGVNQQLTSAEGVFIGGIITSTDFPPELIILKSYLLEEVLPVIRDMGWYGVGGFDVLIDSLDRPYFIDCNFRMTGMSAFHLLVANGNITRPLISFGGEFKGSKAEFRRKLLPCGGRSSKSKFLQLIALNRDGDNWSFNAALLFDNPTQLSRRVDKLLQIGVDSLALSQIAGHAD